MGRFTQRLGLLVCLSVGSAPALADDLLSILELAMNNDPTLRQAEAQYMSRHTQLDQGRAALLPSVALSGNTTRQTSGIPGEMSFRPGQNSHGYRLSLSQAVFNLSAWYAYQSAKQSDQAGAISFAAQEQNLIIRVATAYFDVLSAIDNLTTRRQEEEAAQRQFEQTRQREEVGLIAITEVYESQAAYDLARNNTILAEDALASGYEALEAITGQPHPNLEVLREDFPIVNADGTVESWTAQAMDSNLALAAARYNLEAQRFNLKARKADHLPTIALQAGFNHNVTAGSQSADGSQRFAGAIDGTSLALTINVPLYSGGGVQARRRAAEYDVVAQQEALSLTRRQTTQDVRNAFRRVNTDALVISQRQQAITSAQSALDAIEVGYEVGTRNIVDVLQARQQLFIALRNYSDAKYNYVIDTLLLKQITGLLTPQDIIDLNQWLEEQPATAAP
ncbi:MAG: TolC family outer membrane protein [Gammaproteobacteria bacterium]|nr:TolC family outer membrane protein [Gammaproteobacteria bacterium]MDP2141038.1 TolC family outer membrane protein [Gammaproteobacteria bacterium]MDP2348497.1 TolC family outer membrane protein [Gammaproteobacteria bacterium]